MTTWIRGDQRLPGVAPATLLSVAATKHFALPCAGTSAPAHGRAEGDSTWQQPPPPPPPPVTTVMQTSPSDDDRGGQASWPLPAMIAVIAITASAVAAATAATASLVKRHENEGLGSGQLQLHAERTSMSSSTTTAAPSLTGLTTDRQMSMLTGKPAASSSRSPFRGKVDQGGSNLLYFYSVSCPLCRALEGRLPGEIAATGAEGFQPPIQVISICADDDITWAPEVILPCNQRPACNLLLITTCCRS